MPLQKHYMTNKVRVENKRENACCLFEGQLKKILFFVRQKNEVALREIQLHLEPVLVTCN